MDPLPTDGSVPLAIDSGSLEALQVRPAAANRGRAELRDPSGVDFHVAGVVVHAAPSGVGGVAREIAAIAGARVHASSAAGKLVVTLEGSATDAIMSGLEEIRRLHGVLAAALVYQHAEREDLDETGQSGGGSQ
jgi:nitrate reductase NapD